MCYLKKKFYLCSVLSIFFMNRINRQSIYEVLEPAGMQGLHISIIALHLVNKFLNIFEPKPLDRDEVQRKVHKILLYETSSKRSQSYSRMFARVINPKTGMKIQHRYRVNQILNPDPCADLFSS
ncbi:MAG: hypothetical protein LBD53_02360 [Tannerella sp.]|jgi:hypothetical protein|nr:hypothetical protein [Tannerella sp.]